jgi:hypothetical protein
MIEHGGNLFSIGVRPMNRTCKVSFALRVLPALLAVFASTPAFADGECLEWNVTGSWPLTQSNGTRVTLRLQQNGTHLQGVGEYSYYSDAARQQQTVSGPVDGQLEHGNLVRVAAYWSNGSVGLYVGEIQADGGMTGYTSDRNNVNNKATFVASASAQCVSRAAVAPPKPTMALGRVQIPAGTPVAPAKTICEHAASARARNSPAAPGLERQCAAQGGSPASVGFGRVVSPAAPAAAPAVAPASAPAAPVPPVPPAQAQAQRPVDPIDLDAFAATGAEIAGIDPSVAEARSTEGSAFYQLGFDIATGLFGDPILGAEGLAKMDPISTSIRDSLSASGKRGFDASVDFHLAHDYRQP